MEMTTASREGGREQPGEMASSTVTPRLDEQEPTISTEPLHGMLFPLMKLPLELRSKVYKAHLIVPGSIALIHWKVAVLRVDGNVHNPSHQTEEPIDLSVCKLWAVSKTVYHESVPIFFRYNSFRYDNLTRLASFLTCIGPTARRNLTTVSMHYSGKAPAKAMKILKECIGLRHLTIEITRGSLAFMPQSSQDPEIDVMRMYGLTDLLKVRGIEKLVVTASPNLLRYYADVYETVPLLEDALQVLKQPHRPDQLRRQEKKDYPKTAARTVFGKANVKTRAEQKLTVALGH